MGGVGTVLPSVLPFALTLGAPPNPAHIRGLKPRDGPSFFSHHPWSLPLHSPTITLGLLPSLGTTLTVSTAPVGSRESESQKAKVPREHWLLPTAHSDSGGQVISPKW